MPNIKGEAAKWRSRETEEAQEAQQMRKFLNVPQHHIRRIFSTNSNNFGEWANSIYGVNEMERPVDNGQGQSCLQPESDGPILMSASFAQPHSHHSSLTVNIS